MISTVNSLLFQSPLSSSFVFTKSPVPTTLAKANHGFLIRKRNSTLHLVLDKKVIRAIKNTHNSLVSSRKQSFICFYKPKESPENSVSGQESGLDWPILKQWNVPWKWQTVLLTMIACGLSFVLTGLVAESVALYLGIQGGNLSLDEKAELLFLDQFIVTSVILGVVYGITRSFQPFPDDLFCYEWKEPFNLQNGWLLWAGIGFVGAAASIALTGAALSLFSGENPQRETDALVRLLPLIGSSSISTASLVGITGVMAPLLEETVFRGFLMASLTKWVPTPAAVLVSATVFALAHLTPGEFPQLFVLDEWWRNFGIDDLELQTLVIRILSQTCSSSGCERNWSVFERIHTKRRNRLEHKRLNDLVYTHYNLRLKERQASRKSLTDPISLENIDLTDDWVVEAEDDDAPLLDVDEIDDWMDVADAILDEGEGGAAAGFFLNPRFQYEEGFVYSDNIRSGVTKVIERLAPNVTFAIEATREIAQFRGKIGRFGDLTAQTAVGIMNPGSVLGLSYAQTRNLLTPIVIHALWNSGVILLLTFLQLQGYDIRELLQGS